MLDIKDYLRRMIALQDLGPKTFSITLVQNEPTVNTVLPGPLTLTVLDDDGEY